LARPVGVARVNRRLYQRANGMVWIPEVLGKAGVTGDGFIIASLPALALVRRQARARCCRKAPGRTPDRWCAVKRKTLVGWRVHLIRRLHQALTRVPMRPAGLYDLRLACPPGRGG